MSDIITRIRNADVQEIMDILTDQQARQADVIVPASLMRYERGNLAIASDERTQAVTDDGVMDLAGLYRPTSVGDETMASKVGAHGGFIKAMRDKGRHDVIDHVLNDLLHGGGHDYGAEAAWILEHADETGAVAELAPEFPEFGEYAGKIMLRLLKGDPGEEGVLRAALSSRYRVMDNLTVLLAVMEGIQRAGVNAVPSNFDLSDRKLYGRFEVPELAMMAPNLLAGYRSPFDGIGAERRAGEDRPGFRLQSEHGYWTPEAALLAAQREGMGYEPGKEPVVWAGFVISNSDVGYGSRTLSPQIRVRVCKNGLTLLAESDRKVHLGSDQDEGVMWSTETQEKELSLITAQTRDLVSTWMTPEWFGAQVAAIEELAGVPVPKPEPVIEAVAKTVKFSKADQAGILSHFMRGGAYTVGGIGNAITSWSQTVDDAERAAELDAAALPAMKEAARVVVRERAAA